MRRFRLWATPPPEPKTTYSPNPDATEEERERFFLDALDAAMARAGEKPR